MYSVALDWFNAAPRRLVDKALNGERLDKDKEIVILSSVLADSVNVGYQNLVDLEVKKVNGEEVSLPI